MVFLFVGLGLLAALTVFFAISKNRNAKNTYFFGMGTIGRDMFYAMESQFLLFYLSDVIDLSEGMLALVGGILFVLRIFDAFNDPLMGLIVDNTKSRRGKYKPWILIGAVTSAFFMIMLFTNLNVSPFWYVAIFVISYLFWDITYGLNDIAYWSMMPALSLDQKQREKIGSFARICANLGLFAVVVGMVPLTDWLAKEFGGDLAQGWFVFAVAIAVLMIGFQMFTLFGTKEYRGEFKEEEKTTLKGMFLAIFKNDQLLYTVISMALFTIGYVTTTGFGLYFFKYAFGDDQMYSIFAAVVGVSQIVALAIFPLFSKRFSRKQLYTASTVLVFAAYALFFFSPMNMIPLSIAGLLLFVGEAFIQLLMLMFLADTIEYGQWKTGKRNQAVTFSVQPFINKIGGAIATGVSTITLLVSGISAADRTGAPVTAEGITYLKMAMFILPLICIIAGYIIYLKKYKIDKKFYDQIVSDLAERGAIKGEIAE